LNHKTKHTSALTVFLCALSVLCGSLALAGCSAQRTPEQQASPSVRTPAPAAINPATVVQSAEDWSYAGKPGRAIHTANYRFYVTQTDPILVNRLPLYMETAMSFYRTSFAGLPPPPGKLDTFIMATRGQWETLTRQLMGDNAATYLRIQRGGFASGGRGVFYDIGAADTLSIAGHEGWHQYTQRTFAEPLPIWLEEGIATTMEGYRWESTGPAILPWSNTERFDQLRAAAAQGTLMPLIDIFETSPQELLAPASLAEVTADPSSPRRATDAALTYYAQIWALVHFLREGENGKYRDAFIQAVNDACDGRLGRGMAAKLGDRGARASLLRRKGPGLAMAYFTLDIDTMAQEYARFVEIIVRPGSRGPVVEGRSPFGVN
jgi:hypothetical protein